MIWSIDQGIDNQVLSIGRKIKVPFYVIAHMANTHGSLDWAVKNGANAIETDLQFDRDGNPGNFVHDIPCDCHCVVHDDHICLNALSGACFGRRASNDAKSHLQHAATFEELALIIIDSKVKAKWGKKMSIAGERVVDFLDEHLFQNGYKGNVIIGSGKIETYEYIRAATEAANHSPYKTRYYFTFDQEGDDYSNVIAMLSRLTGSRVYGTGISSCAPGKYYDAIEKAAQGRVHYEHGLSYIWTIDKESSMEEYIERGVQGIMTNRVQIARSLAEKHGLYMAQYFDAIPVSTTSIDAPNKCDCNYYAGGCTISWPAPSGQACKCKYKGAWTCSGALVACDSGEEKCDKPDASSEACKLGKGDCDGY
jgi:glycerophosphoryl diester phosphodiesterase